MSEEKRVDKEMLIKDLKVEIFDIIREQEGLSFRLDKLQKVKVQKVQEIQKLEKNKGE